MFSDQTITPTFIDDIARALDIFIQKRPTGTYHIVGSPPLTPYILAKKIAKTFDFDENPRPVDGDEDDIAIVDIGAFERQ